MQCFKLVIISEENFKKKQFSSSVVDVFLEEIEELNVLTEFLKKTYNATDIQTLTANQVLYDRTGDFSSAELFQRSRFSFEYLIRDYDVVSFKVPKEEGSFIAYYATETVFKNLADYS